MRSNKPRFSKVEEAILKTLLYSDIFDFPLTKEELWRFLISDKKIEFEEFNKDLKKLISIDKEVSKDSSSTFYCLLKRDEIFIKRIENLKEVKKKLAIAK